MTQTVIVAGAGPTGLMLAAELRLGGVDVTVIEPRAGIGEHSLGMAIHGRTLEVMKQRGLADELRSAGLFAWPRTPFSMLWLDLDGAGPDDYTYGLPQWQTERVLFRRAAALGADIRWGHRVTGLTEDAEGVVVDVSTADGEQSQLRAGYLVGCDGADSTVRRLAGIELEEHESSGYYGILGDVEPEEGEEFAAGLYPTGLFGAIPLSENTLRLMTVEFGARPVDADGPATEAELRASIERITGTAPRLRQARYVGRYGRPSVVARCFRKGRVLLAGDAAHVFFVSGTQGLNTGIQDAVNLGWKLAAEVNGWAPDGLVDSYQEERLPAASRACAHARAQIALMHPLEKVQPLREMFAELLRFPEVNQHLLRMPTEVRYPAPEPGDHPLHGLPIEDAPLSCPTGQTTIAETLCAARGVLLWFSGESGPPLNRWPGRVDVVVAKPVPGIDADFLLIRPDGQIAVAGSDVARLERVLRTWFGTPVG
ncbi:FAD-dependent monooxygenase [Actinoallomurus soli]|uniref:FAD-dependent monooxygenase n=1 Tax=Actinoallomurus soli TaxID=2952535 RepID=UPI0020933657|nr:FAD-dependent monooxygenase [Actinoallomurus soli]MCO5974064.1 FAD-dependent monooxygenase [Actinoallomurus soli]